MEIAIIIVVAVVVAWFFGFVKSLRTIAETANTEVASYNVIHKNKVAKKLASLDINEEDWVKAKEAIAKSRELTLD